MNIIKKMFGGVDVPHKKELSENSPIKFAGIPDELVLFLSQHTGAPSVPVVKRRQSVKRGQVIAESQGYVSAALHAPTSGTVKAIEPRYQPVKACMSEAIIIEPDGEHESLEELWPTVSKLDEISVEAIIEKAKESGLVGLGGAAFPTAVKLSPPKDKLIDTYLLNGAECEPYITADDRLMIEEAQKVIFGFKAFMKATGVKRGIICIENNKPDAISSMKNAMSGYRGLELAVLTARYPRGGEKSLIQSVLDKEVPPTYGLPLDVGVIVSNVGTAFAMAETLLTGLPLVERIVSVTGEGVANPSNFKTLIGTPVSYLIEQAGGFAGEVGKVVMGGPMMGPAIKSLDVPILKGTSGVLVFTKDQTVQEPILPCIRCGKCVDVCPMGLQPVWMSSYAERGLFEEAEKYRVMDCCECGACTFICPAKRPLMQWIRMAKADVSKRNSQKKT